MEHTEQKHRETIKKLCRVCGNRVQSWAQEQAKRQARKCSSYTTEIHLYFGIDVSQDSDCHSTVICLKCVARISKFKTRLLTPLTLQSARNICNTTTVIWCSFDETKTLEECSLCCHYSSVAKGGRPRNTTKQPERKGRKSISVTSHPDETTGPEVSPAFLHANSTSHTWAFSAFAELIDNAYDPDVSASELLIDQVDIRENPCLIFLDNGAGMDREHLLKMLSFGFCEKDVYESQGSHQPIGHYGNGFKSGSMRLGQDALVFTRCQKSASIGFLSQTYLAAIKTDSVVVPILEYRLPHLERIKSQESRNNLNAVLQFSVFKEEWELKEELKALEGSKTGTKIIIYNLKRLQGNTLELDFSSDPRDIRCPEAHEADMTSVYHRPIQQNMSSEYKRSLREYCSILFLRPRMKITIRGVRVKSKLISKSLSNTEIDMYKPTWLVRPVKIIFGFTCETEKSEDYGMMLYHRNRLIKAYEKVGYQKQPNDLGIGVVGVAQVDFLQPIHNKQDFNKDEKYNSVMSAFAAKLNDYWNEKKNQGTSSATNIRVNPDWLWAQCDQCLKWRRLPDGIDTDTLPELWYCRMNPDATHNRCDIPEEPEDEDLALRPTYEKTYKKKQEERKRLQQIEKQKEDETKIRKIMQKEMELKEKEDALKAIQHAATSQPIQQNKAFSSLRKALEEARKREEQQKRVILQIQEKNKEMEAQRNTLLQMAETLKGHVNNETLNHLSQVLGSFVNQDVLAPSITPAKRKPTEQPQSLPNNRGSKRLCIKTETGEEISITRNDINDEEEENNTRPSPSTSARRRPRQRSEPLKLPVSFSHTKQTNSGTSAVTTSKKDTSKTVSTSVVTPTPASTKTSSSSTSTTKTSSPSTSTPPSASPATSTPSARQKKRSKNSVMAVIDLTNESEFGELVDIKPDPEELRSALRDNLRLETDVKPDKDALDSALAQAGQSEAGKSTTQEVAETKQELLENGNDKENKDVENGVQFGPSPVDSNTPMDFQDTIEVAMAAIQDRLNKEKSETEGNKDNVSGAPAANEEKQNRSDVPESSEAQAVTSGNNGNNTDDAHKNISGSSGDDKETEKCEGKTNGAGQIASGEENENTQSATNKDGSPDNEGVNAFDEEDNNAYDEEDNGFNSDCHDEDSDYRGNCLVDEKGDKQDVVNNTKKCDRTGSGRFSSTEDSAGSSGHHQKNVGVDESDNESQKLVDENNVDRGSNTANTNHQPNESQTVDGASPKNSCSDKENIEEPMESTCSTGEKVNCALNKAQISAASEKSKGSHMSDDNTPLSFDSSTCDADKFTEKMPGHSVCQNKDHMSNTAVINEEMETVSTADFDILEQNTVDVREKPADKHEASKSKDLSCGNKTVCEELQNGKQSDSQKDSVTSHFEHQSPAELSVPLLPPTTDCSPPVSDYVEGAENRNGVTENHLSPANEETERIKPVHQIKEQIEGSNGHDSLQKLDRARFCNKDVQTDIKTFPENAIPKADIPQSNKSFSSQAIQTSIDESTKLFKCVTVDKSLQTQGNAGLFCDVELQTDLLSEADKETIEELRTKLSLKSELLQQSEERLCEFRNNTHRILLCLVPDQDLGDASDIEQVVRDLIKFKEESSQQSQFQESDDRTL